MLVIIPARLGSSRLPEKPLAMIGNAPLVVHVWRRAIEADVGPVWVATDSPIVAGQIVALDGQAIVVMGDVPSGTDRVAVAANMIDAEGRHSLVLNVQGDMPFVSPDLIRQVALVLKTSSADIVTSAHDEQYVEARDENFHRVSCLRHIGIYGFHRDALERFARLGQTPREMGERLEQLRAVQHGMRIEVVNADTFPLEINTPADLAEARQMVRCLS